MPETIYLINRKFIVKQLCREYGIKDYMTLLKLSKQFHQLLSWIVIQEPDEKVHLISLNLMSVDLLSF